MTRIKWSKGPDEWYCSYGTCYKCNTEFMCSKAHYCPGCGEEIEELKKPEYIGVGNFDEDRYVYAVCKCPVTEGWAIKFNKILDGKPHRYLCVCENCGTEVGVYTK